MITSLDQLDLNKKYTYADYLTWQITERVELIKGKIFKMAPAPNLYHQQVSGRLFVALFTQLNLKKCQVFAAPFDVRLHKKEASDKSTETVVQPDICIVCDKEKLDRKGCNGSPDFIVEILSLSTSKRDLQDKKELYAINKIPEYWIIHPTDGTVIRYLLEKGNKEYVFNGIFTLGDTLELVSIAGISIELNKLFFDL